MKAIILLAGYATRLYPLTMNTPKALLEINHKPILDYIYDEIETINDIDEVFLVTNHTFYENFLQWKQKKNSSKTIKLIDDGTVSNEGRLGAIGDIRLVIQNEKIDDDILVIAGDNFFTFRLSDFYRYFLSVNYDCTCVHKLNDSETLKRLGVAVLDENNRIVDMEEKPQKPKSNITVDAIYIYKKDTLHLFDEYLNSGNNPDAPGYFPAWLYKVRPLYAYDPNTECYDIGTHETYNEVKRLFESKEIRL